MRNCPEMLKTLDLVELSWLTQIFSVAWRLGTVPVELQTWVVEPIFKRGTRGYAHTPLRLLGKAYARLLEKRIWPIIKPQI